jgi:hypothetical protein
LDGTTTRLFENILPNEMILLSRPCAIRLNSQWTSKVKTQDNALMSVTKRTLLHLLVEVLIYAALISVYLVLVLHFLVGWLKDLSAKDPVMYAFVAILLMIVQAVGLERVASSLVHVTRRRRG